MSEIKRYSFIEQTNNLSATVVDFLPVQLVFAWVEVENIPLILGRTNFFKVFNVCFYGLQSSFEISSSFKK